MRIRVYGHLHWCPPMHGDCQMIGKVAVLDSLRIPSFWMLGSGFRLLSLGFGLLLAVQCGGIYAIGLSWVTLLLPLKLIYPQVT